MLAIAARMHRLFNDSGRQFNRIHYFVASAIFSITSSYESNVE